jgi:zinc protease
VRLDKNNWEEAKADLAARIGASAGRETSSMSLSVTKERLDAAFALYAEMLSSPGLRPADLERLRTRHVAAVAQARASVEGISGRVAGPVYWGNQHPFGSVVTEASLKAVALADCVRVSQAFAPGQAQLFVAGDVTKQEVQQLFATHLKGWRGSATKLQPVPAPKPMSGRYFFVDVPGAAQSQVMVVQRGPVRQDKAYAANLLMGTIYGGGFSSRLNMNLREKNGFTYGARGGLSTTREHGQVVSSSSIRTDATEAALREMAKELTAMHAGQPSDAELKREKQGALLAYPALFASNAGVMAQAMDLWFYGLSFDEWTTYPAALRAVDAAAVEMSAQRVLKPKEALVIVTGDAKVVRPALEALAKDAVFGAGTVVELDADARVKGK